MNENKMQTNYIRTLNPLEFLIKTSKQKSIASTGI